MQSASREPAGDDQYGIETAQKGSTFCDDEQWTRQIDPRPLKYVEPRDRNEQVDEIVCEEFPFVTGEAQAQEEIGHKDETNHKLELEESGAEVILFDMYNVVRHRYQNQ